MPLGPHQPVTTQPDDVIGHARRLIHEGAIDLLTCDVFDTLVWRPVARPDHLFVRLGRQLSECGLLPDHVDAQAFRRGRAEAELAARRRARAERDSWECTLEEIWERMPERWAGDAPLAWRERGLDWELHLEGASLRPHQPVVDLLHHAHENGVRTTLVSDTYFSAAQLRGLLDEAGVPLEAVDRIVTSSEAGHSKYEGLLADVVDEEGSRPQRAVHLGDNPVADVRAAEELGAIALQSTIDRDDQAAPDVLEAIEVFSAVHGTDGGTSATVAGLLAGPGVRPSPARQFGITVGGPTLAGYVRWLAHTADELGVERLHCLMREGDFLATLLEQSYPAGPEPVRVHASRWVVLRAGVFDGTADELWPALARKVRFEPSHVSEAFGIDPALVARVLGDGPIDDLGRETAIEAIAADDELREAIVGASATLRKRLLRYLDSVLRPDHGTLVLCDIGWGGTIQDGLETILRREGRLAPEDAVIGLYLSLSEPGVQRVGRGARMHGYLPNDVTHEREQRILQRTPEILEQLCTPDLGTLLDIDDAGRPVCAEHDPTFTTSRDIAQQATAQTAIEILATNRRLGEDEFWCHPDMRAALLRGVSATLQVPSSELAAELATWRHDDIAGGSTVPLADVASVPQLPFLNAADLEAVPMRDVFWLAGAAAMGNRPLAAQLAATAAGVDPEDLCPEAETGRATLAVFETGSVDAVRVVHPTPRLGPTGWSLMRLETNIGALRDVRIDFGTSDLLVELAHVRITFGDGDGEGDGDGTWSIRSFRDRRLYFLDGRALSPTRAVLRAGGHIIIPFGDTPAVAHRFLAVDCAFRTTALHPDDATALLPSPTVERGRQAIRRVRSAASRRCRSWRAG